MPDGHVAMLVSNEFRTDARSIKTAVSLARFGLRVTVYAWDRSGEASAAPDGVSVRALGPRSTYGRGLFQLPAYLLYMGRVLFALLRNRVDAIHCHRLDCLCIGAVAAVIRRCPLVYDAHMPFAERLSVHSRQFGMGLAIALARSAEHTLLRYLVDWTFVDGPLHAQQLGATRGPINVLLNVPERDFVPQSQGQPVEGRGFCFGRIGLISGQMGQGVEDLADVLRRLLAVRPALQPRLVMVGPIVPPSYAADIAAVLEPLGSSASVSGAVPRHQVGDQYRRLDVSVVLYPASQAGGFGALGSQQKVFESMAHGVPLVIFSNAYMNQVVADAGCGVVLKEGGSDELLDALLLLADADDMRSRMSRAGHRAFVNRYNWETQEQQLRGAYDRLLLMAT